MPIDKTVLENLKEGQPIQIWTNRDGHFEKSKLGFYAGPCKDDKEIRGIALQSAINYAGEEIDKRYENLTNIEKIVTFEKTDEYGKVLTKRQRRKKAVDYLKKSLQEMNFPLEVGDYSLKNCYIYRSRSDWDIISFLNKIESIVPRIINSCSMNFDGLQEGSKKGFKKEDKNWWSKKFKIEGLDVESSEFYINIERKYKTKPINKNLLEKIAYEEKHIYGNINISEKYILDIQVEFDEQKCRFFDEELLSDRDGIREKYFSLSYKKSELDRVSFIGKVHPDLPKLNSCIKLKK